MVKTDDENLVLAESTQVVDELNSKFYARFPYPWRPLKLDTLSDPDFERIMLNQDNFHDSIKSAIVDTH